MSNVLVFCDDAYPWHWLRVDGGVVARGADLAEIPRDADGDVAVVAVVPATQVVMHWVELPALAPAQAAAAARQLAGDVCGTAIATTHVALGAIGSDGLRPLALVDRAVMTGWLEDLAAAGMTVDRVIPMPLLLPIDDADDAPAAVMSVGDSAHVRGRQLAFTAELPLAELMLAGRATVPLPHAAFEDGLASALAAAPLDLRQGEFARRQQRPIDLNRWRRIALTFAAAAVLWLGDQVAAVLRDGLAADRVEQQAADAARAVLPRGTAIDAPRAQVAAYADRLGAAGHGFTVLAVPLLTAMRDRSAMVLQSLQYAPETGLVAVVVAPSSADQAALASGITNAGVAATVGSPRDDGGQPVVDVVVRPG